jgi:hypothetical protein
MYLPSFQMMCPYCQGCPLLPFLIDINCYQAEFYNNGGKGDGGITKSTTKTSN